MSRVKPEHPTEGQVFEAALALETYLKKAEINYAIVGGLAVKIWGGSRMTDDVDTAVDLSSTNPDEPTSDKIRELRGAIAKSNSKSWEAVIAKPPLVYYTDKTNPKSPIIGCDILGAPGIAGPPLTDFTTKIVENKFLVSARVLQIPYLLYSKLVAWDSRGNSERPEKAATDSIDIAFLVEKMAKEKMDMAVYLDKAHWNREGLMDKVIECASKWVKTGDGLGGKDKGTEAFWAAINVHLK